MNVCKQGQNLVRSSPFPANSALPVNHPSPRQNHITPDRLLEIAPHYYDLSNFPKGETKYELEACAKRVFNL